MGLGWLYDFSLLFPLNSFRFKDTYGSAMSLSYSIWDCATCWYERRADQPWSCIRRSAQYFPSNECSSCSSSSSSLWEISSGKCLVLVCLVLRAAYSKCKTCRVKSSSVSVIWGVCYGEDELNSLHLANSVFNTPFCFIWEQL